MTRKAFYSFHYDADNWRASQVRNMGIIEGNKPASDNDWETIKKGGEKEIQKWIDNQIIGRSVAIVLIGAETAGRKWIDYEIKKAWNDKKGLLGIHIHRLKDKDGKQSTKGANPFSSFTVAKDSLSDIVKTYDPQGDSKEVYKNIETNLEKWIEEAIRIRKET